jgi:hypothetical protein
MAATNAYERIGTVPIAEFLAVEGKFIFNGESVPTSGKRIATFRAHGTICSCCGLKATHFAIERHKGTTHGYHANLWGIGANGQEVLFTHDHTLARALGGANQLHNTTTMCSPCNRKKSKGEHLEVQRRRGVVLPTQVSREQAKQRRNAKIAERCATDPHYAARVEHHKARAALLKNS